MIEQHYGHITPAHIAAKLAGPRMGPREDAKQKTNLSLHIREAITR